MLLAKESKSKTNKIFLIDIDFNEQVELREKIRKKCMDLWLKIEKSKHVMWTNKTSKVWLRNLKTVSVDNLTNKSLKITKNSKMGHTPLNCIETIWLASNSEFLDKKSNIFLLTNQRTSLTWKTSLKIFNSWIIIINKKGQVSRCVEIVL